MHAPMPCTPPAMQAPLPCRSPSHTPPAMHTPPPTMHIPLPHTSSQHAHLLPHMLSPATHAPHHARPHATHSPPATHAPPCYARSPTMHAPMPRTPHPPRHTCLPHASHADGNKLPVVFQTGAQWFLNNTGAGATTHLEAGAFIRSRPGVEHPDIQYHFLPSVVIDHGSELGDCHAFQVQHKITSTCLKNDFKYSGPVSMTPASISFYRDSYVNVIRSGQTYNSYSIQFQLQLIQCSITLLFRCTLGL